MAVLQSGEDHMARVVGRPVHLPRLECTLQKHKPAPSAQGWLSGCQGQSLQGDLA
jgi:hypothetical protein